MSAKEIFKQELLTKIISRKLTVWLGATFALFEGVISPPEWVVVTVAYVVGQAIADAASHFKRGDNKNAESDNS